MDVSQISQAAVTSLDELKAPQASAGHIADFERAMGGGGESLGGNLLNEIGQIKERFSQAKHDLEVKLSTPGDDPSSLMQMQWSLMRISMQEELIAKTVGRMSQNVETLMKTQ
ncbi:type III secretion system inner rod subunit SctI [Pseudomonas koreensis]|jgi:type III secretion protein I|uniref:type III secretion system inner rod subunit SctI n=1 Tax=Pseudomonas koreensis TaxID=198620 RepID=UPI001B3422D8|nr:type III secretion system inner rod subunit SctI [Pseudomonas koreensis]MBP3996500.1 type III secretion system inner rod subunit SctI [Pseudomonas koreensis]